MKAFLLAAGYGTRLRPITDTIPKCMVPIKGIPLLGWWFRLLRLHEVAEVLVNTHYLPGPVCDYVKSYNRLNTGLKAEITYEESLLGSAGTVRENKDFIGSDQDFFICYADNLTDLNLSALLSAHRENGGLLTMALFHTDKPEQCGIATLDKRRRIVDFEEKPKVPTGDLANAGVYVAQRLLFEHFPAKTPLDFGKDVLPLMKGQMYGYETADYLLDIGTPENYRRAETLEL
jgi:Nucleoside-diphosphate-sugar pyrophosphorylase involved in lipopolysaccharide biosynthesis/translation initiation factor 2B, gamma/epsilon subunits (eIF-2Bgamma/eIF-2Bepsilon)